MSDTSQPADRVAFLMLVESKGLASASVANAVMNCQLLVPETTAYLLNLPCPCTYAQAAATNLFRLANGVGG